MTLSQDDRRFGAARVSRRQFLGRVISAAVAPLVVGCGGSGDEPLGLTSISQRLSARPGTPTLTPEIGWSWLGLGGSRDGLLYVPTSYSPETPSPLLVLLHGNGGDASYWANYEAKAEQRGAILLTPDSRTEGWELIFGGFSGGDVRFLDDALQHTFDRCRVDPSQLALGGVSTGASYAVSSGLSNGDLFSHLIGFSPGSVLRFDPLVGKPPVFISHGASDAVFPADHTRDEIVPRLRADGHNVTYVEFDGGHEVPPEITESALDWFQQA